jgi:hypothetical protein
MRWIHNALARLFRPGPAVRRPCVRLGLEGLEDRAVPTVSLSPAGQLTVQADHPGDHITLGTMTERYYGVDYVEVYVSVNGRSSIFTPYDPQVTGITVNTLAGGAASVNVEELLDGVDLTVNCSGADTVHLGNSRDGLQDLRGGLNIVGKPGAAYSLVVDDAADRAPHQAILGDSFGMGGILGLAPNEIKYGTAGLQGLTVWGSHPPCGHSTWWLPSTPAGVPVTLHAGAGDDVLVGSAWRGAQDIQGGLTIQGPGHQHLHVYDGQAAGAPLPAVTAGYGIDHLSLPGAADIAFGPNTDVTLLRLGSEIQPFQWGEQQYQLSVPGQTQQGGVDDCQHGDGNNSPGGHLKYSHGPNLPVPSPPRHQPGNPSVVYDHE